MRCGQMGGTSRQARDPWSVSLDRAGRILIALGSVVALLVVVLPAIGYALFGVSWASIGGEGIFGCSTECRGAILFVAVLPALGLVAAVIMAIWLMLAGGTVSLAVGGIGAFIVGAATFVRLSQEDGVSYWLVAIGAGAFVLAIGATFRLIARRESPGRS